MYRALRQAMVLALSFGAWIGAHAQVDQAIYTDSLVNGWQNYGWASLNYASAGTVHSGSAAVSVTATAAYQALYLHHAAFDTSPYAALTFWINGGASGGQALEVQATVGGVAQTGYVLGVLPPGTWQQVTIPLASLKADHIANMDGFWIQDRSGQVQPTYYVDDIKLTGAAPPAVIHVSVDASQAIRVVDGRLFGVNAAVWDSAFDTKATAGFLQNMGTRIMRFPGGSLSDEYHWASNTTSSNTWTWATSFDHFAHIATNVNSQAFITVNYGTGTPQEAADWVRYSSVTKHYGLKYWEIGNENYGGWETDTNQLPQDPLTYANRAADYIAQMKAVDPTIKAGVVVVTGEDSYATAYPGRAVVNPRTGRSHTGWTPVMLARLKSLGVTPDYVIYHNYPQGSGQESDAGLLQTSRAWASYAADLRQQLTDYLGAAQTNVELICTENNSVSSNPSKQTTSLVNGLFLADSLGQIAQTEFKAFVWWDLRNGQDTTHISPALYGWRAYGDYGVVSGANDPYPTYYAAKALTHFAADGDTIVQATSDNTLLAAYAARRTNGALTLLVINKAPNNTLNTSVQLSGFTPATNAVAYAYGITQDNAAQTGVGSPDVSQTAATVSGPSFSMSFPAYSITVLALAPQVVAAPRLALPTAATLVNGSFQFQVDGQPGARYLVEYSTNLANWIPLATNTAPGAEVNVSDPNLSNAPRRYYRAVLLQ